ncbi:MAG: winged helix-turn-helix domain-containing protein [Fimbriimonadaceae bacterium]
MLTGSFSASDLEKMKSHNESRWQYNVRWTLTELKRNGLVERGGSKGVWKLTSRT